MLSRLNDYRKEGKFCDVKLIVNGVEFPAHKNVLAAAFNPHFEVSYGSQCGNRAINSQTMFFLFVFRQCFWVNLSKLTRIVLPGKA